MWGPLEETSGEEPWWVYERSILESPSFPLPYHRSGPSCSTVCLIALLDSLEIAMDLHAKVPRYGVRVLECVQVRWWVVFRQTEKFILACQCVCRHFECRASKRLRPGVLIFHFVYGKQSKGCQSQIVGAFIPGAGSHLITSNNAAYGPSCGDVHELIIGG